MHWLFRTLKSPINRLGFLIFITGTAMVLIAVWGGTQWFDAWGVWSPKLGWQDLFVSNYRVRWWQLIFRWGSGLTLLGAWLAWFFEPTIGRLTKWIKAG